MTRITDIALRTVAAAAVIASSARALAEEPEPAPPEPTPLEASPEPLSPRDQARAYYQQGIAHAQAAQWAEAHSAFVSAEALYSAPTNVFNIGQCERALGRYVAARATFHRFLAMSDPVKDAAFRSAAEGYLEELGARISRVRIIAEPRSARVSIDGKTLPACARARRCTHDAELDPGHHTVQVRAKGYEPEFIDRELRPAQHTSLRVRLERLPATLSVDANIAGAEVVVRGDRVGTVPWQGERPAGSYAITVRAEGYDDYDSTLTVASGESSQLNAILTPETPNIGTRWWFWTALGAGAASVALTTWAVTRPDPPPEDYDGGSLEWVVAF